MRKHVNLGDLVKSFLTSIYSQIPASIQPRTSLSQFEADATHFLISLLSHETPKDGSPGGCELDAYLRPSGHSKAITVQFFSGIF